MKRKATTFVLIFILFSGITQAQLCISAKAGTGLNVVHIKRKFLFEEIRYVPQLYYTLGVNLEFPMSENLTLGAGGNFFQRTTKVVNTFAYGAPTEIYNTYNHYYAGLPIVANFLFTEKIGFTGGFSNNFFLQKTEKEKMFETSTNTEKLDDENYSLAFVFGIQYKISGKTLLSISWQADYLDSYKKQGTDFTPMYMSNHSIFCSLSYQFYEFKKDD